MGKILTNRAKRRKLERELAKGGQRSSLSDEHLLYKVKYDLNESQSKTLIKSISPERLKKIKGNSLPKKYSDLRSSGKTFAKDDLISELRWYTAEFEDYNLEINNFLHLEELFDAFFLKGDYAEAKKIIDLIEETICFSHWTIEKRLLLAEYEIGFKKNKEILTEIIDKENNLLTNILAKHQSIRVEKNLSYFKYEEIIHRYTEVYKDEKLKEYLNFKLNLFSQSTFSHKGFFLNFENSSSIIDKYNSFMRLVLMVVSEREKNSKTIESIIINLNQLYTKVKDIRIINILYSLGEQPNFTINEDNKEYLNILDLYSQGEYESVVCILKFYILEHSNCFELYELYNKSLISINMPFENLFKTDSLAGQCLQDLYNILNKNEKTKQSLINGHKAFNSIGLTGWSYKYFAFFNNEHSNKDPKIDIDKYAYFNSNYFNPIITMFFDNKQNSLLFLNKIQEQLSSFTTVIFWKNICSILFKLNYQEGNIKIHPFRENLYQIKTLQAIGDYSKALEGYIKIQNTSEYINEIALPHNNVEIIHGILFCLLNLNEFEKAVDLSAEYNITNPNLTNKLRFNYLIAKITKFDDEILMKNISTSIVLHQYQTYVNPNDIWIAYDNFLSSFSLNYPKEIETILGDLNKEKTIYFLRHICKQEVFDSSYWFENQDELDNERIEICSILTRLDKNNFEEYINEISEISRHILIRKGIKQMDESKIYVDVKGIKKSLEKDIRESFERSMNLLNLSLDQIQKLDLNSENVIVPYYGKSFETNKIEFKESNIKITSYSRFQQFLDMFTKIRDKFIASNEFGIDTYLSMRIRHGTLLGEIRSVFENYHLVTKKEDTSNKYKDNIYWQKNNFGNNISIKVKFNQLMSEFSEGIDAISEKLKNKKLQIRTEMKGSEGLFDYSFEQNELLDIFTNKVGAIDNFEDFFDEIINILWERTEKVLSFIREKISDNVKESMVELLVKLSQNLENLINKNESPEINELIRNITLCQTDIKNELDKIAEWFKRTNSKTINEFYINLPIDATLTTLKRLFKDYNNFEPTIKYNCNTKFEGEYFPHFTYIMQNLLHNIIEHAQLPCEDLKVNIEVTQVDNMLNIIIENNFSKNIDLIHRNKRIESTRQLLLQSHDNDKIRAEEGTGYLKIKKTLKSDLGRDDFSIKLFNVDENRAFKTIINFKIDNLQKNEP